MMTPRLVVDHPGAVEETVKVLAAGGLVVLPTDTVYGLAAMPAIDAATAALFARKSRETATPLAVLCATAQSAIDLADLSDRTAQERTRRWAAEHWPGPLTMVLPRRDDLDWNLGEPTHTIGVRVPDHDFVRAVADRIGPLAVTSANRSGEPTPPTAEDAAATLAGSVDLVVDGGPLTGTASTVVEVSSGTVLRQGTVHL